jgi:hypothetical protein
VLAGRDNHLYVSDSEAHRVRVLTLS